MTVRRMGKRVVVEGVAWAAVVRPSGPSMEAWARYVQDGGEHPAVTYRVRLVGPGGWRSITRTDSPLSFWTWLARELDRPGLKGNQS